MGSIGEMLARRAAMSGVALRPRRLPRVSHAVPANGQANWESPTAVVTDSENARAMALLRGIEPRPFSDPDDVEPEVGPDVGPVSQGLSVSPGLSDFPGPDGSQRLDDFPRLSVSPGLSDFPGPDGSQRLDDFPRLSISHGLDDALGLDAALADSVQALENLRSVTVACAQTFGFTEAAGFAGRVEEISRTVEYLQVIAAHAVERTRTQAQQARPSSSAGTGWQTGWTDPATTDPAVPASTAGPNPATATAGIAGASRAATSEGAVAGSAAVTAADAAAVAMMATGMPRNSCVRACGSAKAKPTVGSHWPLRSSPGPESPGNTSRPAVKSWPRPSKPRRYPPGPRRSSAAHWIKYASSPTTTPSPGWNTPSPAPPSSPTPTSSPK